MKRPMRQPSQRSQHTAQQMACFTDYASQPVDHMANIKEAFLRAATESTEILDGVVIPLELWEALDTAIDKAPPQGFSSIANRIIPA